MEYLKATQSKLANLFRLAFAGLEVIGEASIKSQQALLVDSISQGLCSNELMRLADGTTNPTSLTDAIILTKARNIGHDIKSNLLKLKRTGLDEETIQNMILERIATIRSIEPDEASEFVMGRIDRIKTNLKR